MSDSNWGWIGVVLWEVVGLIVFYAWLHSRVANEDDRFCWILIIAIALSPTCTLHPSFTPLEARVVLYEPYGGEWNPSLYGTPIYFDQTDSLTIPFERTRERHFRPGIYLRGSNQNLNKLSLMLKVPKGLKVRAEKPWTSNPDWVDHDEYFIKFKPEESISRNNGRNFPLIGLTFDKEQPCPIIYSISGTTAKGKGFQTPERILLIKFK